MIRRAAGCSAQQIVASAVAQRRKRNASVSGRHSSRSDASNSTSIDPAPIRAVVASRPARCQGACERPIAIRNTRCRSCPGASLLMPSRAARLWSFITLHAHVSFPQAPVRPLQSANARLAAVNGLEVTRRCLAQRFNNWQNTGAAQR